MYVTLNANFTVIVYHIYIYMHMYMSMYIYIYMYVYVYTYIYTHPSIPMFEPMTVKIAPNYNDSARY